MKMAGEKAELRDSCGEKVTNWVTIWLNMKRHGILLARPHLHFVLAFFLRRSAIDWGCRYEQYVTRVVRKVLC